MIGAIDPMWHTLPPGTMLLERYRIEKALSPNKYLVWDSCSGERAVAVEFFPWSFDREADLGPSVPPGAADAYQAALERFLRRGEQIRELLGTLPSVIHVKDIFRANRTAYIVEEYVVPPAGVERADLAYRNRWTDLRRWPIPAEELLPLLEQVILDLGTAHRVGILHGALTADHLLLDSHGNLRLTGFYRATRLYEPDYRRQYDSQPEYIPPEVRQGGSWIPCGEVYSLCATIYLCLTGLSIQDARHKHGNDHGIPNPDQLCTGLSKQQGDCIMLGLRSIPSQRWQNMEEFHHALYPSAVRKGIARAWTFLRKGRGPKQIAPIHYIGAAAILSLCIAGAALWQRSTAPPSDSAWEQPDLLGGLTESQRALADQGSFISGDLSYEFPFDGLPMVSVTGYVGMGTEVTIPEETEGFPVNSIKPRAFLGSGLEIVYLPDSLPYEPTAFPSGCVVYGGQREAENVPAGETELERQLREATGTE